MIRVDVRLDEQRLKRLVTLDEMIEIQRGNLEAVRDVVSRFMWDSKTNDYYKVEVIEGDDGYVITSDARARKLLGSLTIEQLTEVMDAFRGKAEKVAVDPRNAAP